MSEESKTVSVVMTVRGRVAYMAAAIDSVLTQSYRDIELIVVDNGSTDTTASILAAFDDPRLRHIRQEDVLAMRAPDCDGRAEGINLALSSAIGDYVAFLDSEDSYLPDKLALQVDYLEMHPDAGMVYSTARCVDAANNPLEQEYKAIASGNIYAHIAFVKPVEMMLSAVMLRRLALDSVGQFDEQIEKFEDTDLFRRVAKRFPVGALSKTSCLIRLEDNTTR